MPVTSGGVLEAIAVLLTIAATLWKAVPWGVARVASWQASRRRRDAQWTRIVESVQALVADMSIVKAEVQTNGGSTIKDYVNTLSADLALERAARRAAWSQAAYEVQIRPDGSTVVLHVTPHWSMLTGLSQEESQRDGWARSVHPEERDDVLRQANEALEDGAVFAATYRLRNVRTGHEYRVEHIGTPVLNARGRVVGFVGVVTPIDEGGSALRLTQALRGIA